MALRRVLNYALMSLLFGTPALAAGKSSGQTGQHGVASVYWEGQRTASGARFNPNAMTIAHRTLPFGATVQVKIAGSKRSILAVVNDRGPFIRGRIVDLSRGCARALGVSGLARVQLDVMTDGPHQPLKPKFQLEAYQALERITEQQRRYRLREEVAFDL